MKALLGTRPDGTIGLIVSSKLDDLTDDDVLEYIRLHVSTGWKNLVVLDDKSPYAGQLSCRLRRIVTQIVG